MNMEYTYSVHMGYTSGCPIVLKGGYVTTCMKGILVNLIAVIRVTA